MRGDRDRGDALPLQRGSQALRAERLEEDQGGVGHEAHQQWHDLAVHVRKRCDDQGTIRPRAHPRLGDRPRAVDDLAVCEHHALGVGRGAAGEDDLREIAGFDSRLPGRRPSAGVLHVEARLVDPQDGHVQLGCHRRVDVWSGQQQRRASPTPDADRDIGLHAQVQRHDDRSQAPDREVHRHQPGVVLRPGQHPITAPDPGRVEPGHDTLHDRGELTVAPAFVAEVSPDHHGDGIRVALDGSLQQLRERLSAEASHSGRQRRPRDDPRAWHARLLRAAFEASSP